MTGRVMCTNNNQDFKFSCSDFGCLFQCHQGGKKEIHVQISQIKKKGCPDEYVCISIHICMKHFS